MGKKKDKKIARLEAARKAGLEEGRELDAPAGEMAAQPEVLTVTEVLDILQEECAELIMIISKIKRFGWDVFHPKTGIVNRQQFLTEMLDVTAMMEMVQRSGAVDISIVDIERHILDKYNNIMRFRNTQVEL